MAAVTGTVMAGIGAATSVASAISGGIKSNDALDALNNLETPDNRNPYRDVEVSTLGSDIIREEGQRRTANILDTLQSGSARNMFTALPQLMASGNQISERAAMNIDGQMIKRENAIAGYEVEKNRIDEKRYQDDIAGLGGLYEYGQNEMYNGISGTFNGLGNLSRAIGDLPTTGEGKKDYGFEDKIDTSFKL